MSADGRYLDLMKRTLTDYIRIGNPYANALPVEYLNITRPIKRARMRLLQRVLQRLGLAVVKPSKSTVEQRRVNRELGKDWPPLAETMVGLKRLDHLQESIETILAEGVPGDLLEAGVWRGGACIFMQAVLTVHGAGDRRIWLCDSFEGLPPPDPHVPADQGLKFHEYSMLAVSEEQVRQNFENYNLGGDNLRFVKGYFENTLKDAPVESLALLRMDGDMYSSTMAILDALYKKVSPGGFIVVDDYSIEACAKAVHEFRDANGITDKIQPIDDSSVYWRKT